MTKMANFNVSHDQKLKRYKKSIFKIDFRSFIPYFEQKYSRFASKQPKNYNFFVILRAKLKKIRDFYKNPTDPGSESGSVRIRTRILLAKKHGSGSVSAQPWL